ncbi:MAG: hypothetical protein ACE5JL_18910, partial [Dehalococcoidia bacterium]
IILPIGRRLIADEQVDAIMTEISTSILDTRQRRGAEYIDNLIQHLDSHHKRSRKPFFTTIFAINQEVEAIQLRDRLMEVGIPSFPSFHRSANAYKKAVDYYRYRQG